jgi:hypothetical protein
MLSVNLNTLKRRSLILAHSFVEYPLVEYIYIKHSLLPFKIKIKRYILYLYFDWYFHLDYSNIGLKID